MKSIITNNNWLIPRVLVLITILIPLGIMAYEFILLGNESVVFLEDYPSAVGLIILIYYLLLLLGGLIWVIRQLTFILTLKNEKKKNELIHLQSQVNPHFFFNMLNNLYGTIDQDAERAKALVLKLSDLMRYSIYEGEKQLVPIGVEVDYLSNYIDLQVMRYQKSIDIKFTRSINDPSVEIMPLLFIILLENAFKHGVENLRKDAYVHVGLSVNERVVEFNVENNFERIDEAKQLGIGIKNLKRRLTLAYPKKHSLELQELDHVFKANLQLQV